MQAQECSNEEEYDEFEINVGQSMGMLNIYSNINPLFVVLNSEKNATMDLLKIVSYLGKYFNVCIFVHSISLPF